EEQQIGVKWATAIYTLHWLSKGTEYLLQATTFSQGSQSYNIDVPQDMQFVPDEVQKILINAGLYENIRFANLKEKDKSWFNNGWRYEFDEGSGYASYDWVINNYIANFNITSSDNSILINFINRIDAMPQKLDLKINPNKIPFNKIDNKSVIYNSNNELSVPFDNETIYEENGLWKAKQGGNIPSDIIKDSDLNKNYIEKVDGKYIVKTSQDINTKQDKLLPTTDLQIQDINVKGIYVNKDIEFINGASPENTPAFTNAVRAVQNNNSYNDWELVDTSDFVSFSNKKYKIKNYDSTKYIYKIWIGINENNKEIINIMIETYKNHYEFNLFAGFLPIDINKNGEIISGNNKLMALHVERKKVI
ncbi:hypothetical protein, partial [Spiroplasma phoeniceum]|uniref:hypothetical protein n=1 Tax=Spiroplasma phoeniceum TaxID=47835 RepID=UPI003364E90D